MSYRSFTHRSPARRRAAYAGAGVLALLAAGTLNLGAADASPAPSLATLSQAAAGTLAAHLPHGTAGSYYDAASRHLVVNVLDQDTADAVRAKGAEPRVVEHSLAQLAAARSVLASRAALPGTSWATDPKTDSVVVTADRTVTGARLARLTKVVKTLGGRARIHHTKGTFKPFIGGGDAIWGSDARCSLGFNVVKDGQPYFLTAGHCGNAVKSWSDKQGGSEIATTEKSTFPGHDYALVKYTGSTAHPSEVDLYNGSTQPITKAGDATVGESVKRSGSTTQVQSGKVTGLNATVNYEEGSVSGLIQTSVCAEPGDSGGALFDGDTALGLTSGGSGDCTSGGETFFQPVPDALQAYGASIG